MFTIRPASTLDSNARLAALTFLFSDVAASERAFRIEQATNALDHRVLDPDHFLTCWMDDRITGILVCELLPGRAANVWPIHVRTCFEQVGIEDALFAQAIAKCQAGGARFAQSLLPPEDRLRQNAVRRNGFEQVTRVWSMRCDLPSIWLPSPVSLRLESGLSADRDTFQRILMASFEGSLDCPELNGLRTPDEIVQGHISASPDRARWSLAWEGDELVGVIILSEGGLSFHFELSYLGVVPAHRGRGVGKAMLSTCLQELASQGTKELTLLVDERNRPAIEMYRKQGFYTVDIREVFLRISFET